MDEMISKKRSHPDKGSFPRFAFHAIIAVCGWALFVYFWTIVGRRGLSKGASLSLIAMGIFIGAMVVLTSWWVIHNMRISSKNRRKSLQTVEEVPYVIDKVGSRVKLKDTEMIRKAEIIEVVLEGDTKTYRPKHLGGKADGLNELTG